MTARNDAAVTRVIAVIGDDAWQPIPYWDAVEDDDGIIVASSAEVAETTYTAFTSTKAPVTARLVVRRVRRLREAATGQPLDQQALPVPVWRHHAVLTDRIEPLIDVEREHRAHAVVEQSIAELKGGPLAHLPSGDFWARTPTTPLRGASGPPDAWVTLAAMTVNMGRAVATLAGHGLGEATLATLQRTLLTVPARHVHPARRYHPHLPTGRPWQTALTWLKRRIRRPPPDHLTPGHPPTAHHPRTRSTPTRPPHAHKPGNSRSRSTSLDHIRSGASGLMPGTSRLCHGEGETPPEG